MANTDRVADSAVVTDHVRGTAGSRSAWSTPGGCGHRRVGGQAAHRDVGPDGRRGGGRCGCSPDDGICVHDPLVMRRMEYASGLGC